MSIPKCSLIQRCAWIIGFLVIGSLRVFAQEGAVEKPEFKRHKIAVAITHTHVVEGADESGDRTWLMLPSWSVDYDYSITREWGAGLHSDVVIQDFEYEKDEGIIRKRSKPVSFALVGTRALGEHFTVFAGGGLEVATEGTLGLVRLGGDCGWELPGEWELALNIVVDMKINAYNAWVFGLGVGKRF